MDGEADDDEDEDDEMEVGEVWFVPVRLGWYDYIVLLTIGRRFKMDNSLAALHP